VRSPDRSPGESVPAWTVAAAAVTRAAVAASGAEDADAAAFRFTRHGDGPSRVITDGVTAGMALIADTEPPGIG
jgi:hypothetical protein